MEGDGGGRWEEEGGYIEYAEGGGWECPGSRNAVYLTQVIRPPTEAGGSHRRAGESGEHTAGENM